MLSYDQLDSYGKYVSTSIKIFELMARSLASVFVCKGKSEVLAEKYGIRNLYVSMGIFGLVNKSAEDSDVDDEFANNLHATTMSLLENMEVYLPAFYKRCAQYTDHYFLSNWMNEMEDHIAKIQDFVERKTAAQDICWCGKEWKSMENNSGNNSRI